MRIVLNDSNRAHAGREVGGAQGCERGCVACLMEAAVAGRRQHHPWCAACLHERRHRSVSEALWQTEKRRLLCSSYTIFSIGIYISAAASAFREVGLKWWWWWLWCTRWVGVPEHENGQRRIMRIRFPSRLTTLRGNTAKACVFVRVFAKEIRCRFRQCWLWSTDCVFLFVFVGCIIHIYAVHAMHLYVYESASCTAPNVGTNKRAHAWMCLSVRCK